MGFFKKRNSEDDIEIWVKNATDEELENAYEVRRVASHGEKTYEMKKIDEEMSRRTAEKWENDPRRNRDPNYRWTDANRWDKD